MSIASELSALNGYILGAYDEINDKGGAVPANKNMANLASAIASISGGGGGSIDLTGFLGLTKAVSGSFQGIYPGSNSYYAEVTHDLGVVPKLAMYVLADDTWLMQSSSSSSKCAIFGLQIQTGQLDTSTMKLSSGVLVTVAIGGNMQTSGSNTYVAKTSFADSASAQYAAGGFVVDITATRSTYNYNKVAWRGTTTGLSFYRGVNSAYFPPRTSYNYLIAA